MPARLEWPSLFSQKNSGERSFFQQNSTVDRLYHFKWYYDQKVISFFSFDFESVFAKQPTGKILSFVFYPKAVYLECKFSFGFHGPPLLTFKTDR